MTTKTKGRNGGDRATPKTTDSHNHIAIKIRFKAIIVGAACRGLLPIIADDFLIHLLHLGAE